MHQAIQTRSSGKDAALCGPFSQAIPVNAFSMRFARDEEIYGEQEPAEYVYRVISGAVRTYTISEDGRRQIDSFHLPGDVFGFESGPKHRFAAEAVTPCQLAVVSRASLERAAAQDGAAAQELWRFASGELAKVRDHMIMLGKKGAADRVVAFLLDLASHSGSGNVMTLPMSRTDIADYLGLTIETVSRCFTKLERERAISLAGARNVTLKNLHEWDAIAA